MVTLEVTQKTMRTSMEVMVMLLEKTSKNYEEKHEGYR